MAINKEYIDNIKNSRVRIDPENISIIIGHSSDNIFGYCFVYQKYKVKTKKLKYEYSDIIKDQIKTNNKEEFEKFLEKYTKIKDAINTKH